MRVLLLNVPLEAVVSVSVDLPFTPRASDFGFAVSVVVVTTCFCRLVVDGLAFLACGDPRVSGFAVELLLV